MWCKKNNCCHYDSINNKCLRIIKKNGKEKSVCWMEKSEGEY